MERRDPKATRCEETAMKNAKKQIEMLWRR